jgi:dihydropteroate synthase
MGTPEPPHVIKPAAGRDVNMAVLEGSGKSRPLVMGIINATPDSFHHTSREGGIERAMQMIEDGADWIDIGGESTRPGATPISIEEEIARVMPLVSEISKHCKVSIDTRNHEVAREALEAGACMVNDVSGLRDPAMVELVVESGCDVCIMHMLGEPGNMQDNPEYEDVNSEVNDYLIAKARELVELGHPMDKIFLDPGIGFGKRLEHNIQLLRSSDSLRPYSVLWGVSRKSMIGQICDQTNTENRLAGSLAVAAKGFYEGIDIIRVHDVREHIDLFSVLERLEE